VRQVGFGVGVQDVMVVVVEEVVVIVMRWRMRVMMQERFGEG
jgi:hypothetical protein